SVRYTNTDTSQGSPAGPRWCAAENSADDARNVMRIAAVWRMPRRRSRAAPPANAPRRNTSPSCTPAPKDRPTPCAPPPTPPAPRRRAQGGDPVHHDPDQRSERERVDRRFEDHGQKPPAQPGVRAAGDDRGGEEHGRQHRVGDEVVLLAPPQQDEQVARHEIDAVHRGEERDAHRIDEIEGEGREQAGGQVAPAEHGGQGRLGGLGLADVGHGPLARSPPASASILASASAARRFTLPLAVVAAASRMIARAGGPMSSASRNAASPWTGSANVARRLARTSRDAPTPRSMRTASR